MFVAVILSSISCNDSVDKNIEIIPLEGWTREDTNYYKGKVLINRSEFYLVRGFRDNKATKKHLENFLSEKPNNLGKDYNDYVISFYKESQETNLEKIKLRPNVIDPFSKEDDLTYAYGWHRGSFRMILHQKDGSVVEPKADGRIKVKEVSKKTLEESPALR
jgi:hypothetical protein